MHFPDESFDVTAKYKEARIPETNGVRGVIPPGRERGAMKGEEEEEGQGGRGRGRNGGRFLRGVWPSVIFLTPVTRLSWRLLFPFSSATI